MFQPAQIAGKKILLAIDLNERPVGFRFKAALPTIRQLKDAGATQIGLLTHFGRPKGIDSSLSLRNHAKALTEALGEEVQMVRGSEEKSYENIDNSGKIFIFENLRFFDWKKLGVAKNLSEQFDFLIYDAFGLAHRDKPYTTGLIQVFGKDRVFSGPLMDTEVQRLSEFLTTDLPKVLILGGAKLGDKIPILETMLPKVETVYIVGAVANAFWKAQGVEIGCSFCDLTDQNRNQITFEQINRYFQSGKIVLPTAVETAIEEEDFFTRYINKDRIGDNEKIIDIDPVSYGNWDLKNKAVFWNGNAGITEEGYEDGTEELAQIIINKAKISIAGGGDTALWIYKYMVDVHIKKDYKLQDKFTHVSTGGGAALEFLARDSKLPVLEVLRKVKAL